MRRARSEEENGAEGGCYALVRSHRKYCDYSLLHIVVGAEHRVAAGGALYGGDGLHFVDACHTMHNIYSEYVDRSREKYIIETSHFWRLRLFWVACTIWVLRAVKTYTAQLVTHQ